MGWGSGDAKKAILNPASGGLRSCADGSSPFRGKDVLIDISGLAHKAAKRDATEVAQHGTSAEQQQYLRMELESIRGEGGRPVLVLDGRAYPPKFLTRQKRRTAASDAKKKAQHLAGDPTQSKAAEKAWRDAARPEEPFWVWLLEECLRTEVRFIYSPYEADAQLVATEADIGSTAIIWAAANDSDLVIFGGLDVVYDWKPVQRTYRRVKLFDDILGKVRQLASFYI